MNSFIENANRLDSDDASNHSGVQADTAAKRIASAAHEAIDSAADSAERVERKVRQGVADAGETFDKSQEAASRQVKQSIDSLESFLRRRPVAAAGVAFAAGALATALLRR